jgi:molybdopterin-guanine dinucleotide biosynthesis protein A
LVLAGGQSRRFGRDKAAMPVEGEALLARMVRLLESAVDGVYVSVRADQTDDRLRRGYRHIVDEAAGLGPAAGLIAAHHCHPGAAWLVLACDLPFMDEEAIGHLVRARDAGKAATAYRSPGNGLPEPLCAIYEPDTLARFSRKAGAGSELSPRHFLVSADVAYVDPVNDRVLLNVNTPDDLARIQAGDRPGGTRK